MTKVVCQGYEEIDLPGYERKLINAKQVSFNKTNNDIVIPGKSFLITIDNWQYAHVIQECIGHFEFIKKYIPDIKIYFLCPGEYKESVYNSSNNIVSLVFKDLMEKYGVSDSEVINYNSSVTFENVYYLFNFFIKGLKGSTNSNEPIHTSKDKDFEMQLESSRLIRKLFESDKIINQNKNKIFISKTKSDLAYKGFMKRKEELRNIYTNDEEFFKMLKDLQGDNEYNSMEFNNKIRVYENQDKIEDFFRSLGYEIVHNEDIGLFNQINRYYNASHIASINGTGCYNAIFSDPDTKMFMINTHNRFYWFFDELIADNLEPGNLFVFPEQDPTSDEEISIDDILDSLERHKEFM